MSDESFGEIKWYDPIKGFGFILPAVAGGRDVFLHVSRVKEASITQTLQPGDKVAYVGVESPKGTSASKVRLV